LFSLKVSLFVLFYIIFTPPSAQTSFAMTGKKNKPRTVTKYPNAKPGSLKDNTKTVVEKSQSYLRPIAPKPTYVNAPPLDLTTQSVLPDKNDQLAAQETAIKPIKKKKMNIPLTPLPR